MSAILNVLWAFALALGFLVSFDLTYDNVGASFALTTALNLTGLVYAASRSVNLLLVYFIFNLVFFSLLPWLHYSLGHTIWRTFPLDSSIYYYVNNVIFAANVIVVLVYIYTRRSSKEGQRTFMAPATPPSRIWLLLVVSIVSLIALLYINNFSVNQLLFRGMVDESREAAIDSSALTLLFGMTARFLPVFCFLYAVTQLRGAKVIKAILFAVMLLAVFPTGVARYLAACAYIPVLLIFFPALRRAAVFAIVLLASIIFIFPFLDQFRYFSGFSALRFMPSADFFFAAHFDAYENFASAVEAEFVTLGRQLIGAMLFFIPRTFWPDKPVGSGYEMAQQSGYVFSNISMPYLGEGYVNFGLAGVLVFAVAIGYSMARVDRSFTLTNLSLRGIEYRQGIYFFLMGALFFLLRGDLLSSVSYISAGLASAWIVGKVMGSGGASGTAVYRSNSVKFSDGL